MELILNIKRQDIKSKIIVERASISRFHENFKGFDGKFLIISDKNVWNNHGDKISAEFEKIGRDFKKIILNPGEHNKSLAVAAKVYEKMANFEISRSNYLIAFGGGVIGDLAGFLASTYMRGINYVNIPTTVISQVDAAIGGKTGINLSNGKNLVGTFYHSELTIIDSNFLKTLGKREFDSGVAEIIKYAALFSPKLFERLTKKITPNSDCLDEIIASCCKMKLKIVQNDEFDVGQRRLLNFGHTFGHAIEALGNFERYNHGEAIAIGMVLAAKTGEKLKITEPSTTEKLEKVFEIYGLNTKCEYSAPEIMKKVMIDKKSSNDNINMIFLEKIGRGFIKECKISEMSELLTSIL